MKRLKKIPEFKSEKEEREFWQTHSSIDYVDWRQAKLASFPNLKPSTKTISLRLPEYLLNDVKTLANEYDVPYQSLVKIFLVKQVQQEKQKCVLAHKK